MKIKARNKFEIENVRPRELTFIPKEGHVFEVSEERAKFLVDMGFADRVTEKSQKVETAAKEEKTEIASIVKSITKKK